MVETVSSTVSLVRADPSNEFQIFLLEIDPETIILTFARKLERVPVKLDRPRFKRRRGEEDSRERERERDASRATPVEQYALHSCGNSEWFHLCATPFFHSRNLFNDSRVFESLGRIRCESRALTEIYPSKFRHDAPHFDL